MGSFFVMDDIWSFWESSIYILPLAIEFVFYFYEGLICDCENLFLSILIEYDMIILVAIT